LNFLSALLLFAFVLVAIPAQADTVADTVSDVAFATAATPAPTFERVVIAFRDPLPVASKKPNATRQTMYVLRIVDAWSSAYRAQHPVAGYRWHEYDAVTKPFSHTGLLGYAVGFAIEDIVLHTAVRVFHLGPQADKSVDGYQAYSSLQGIAYTETHSR
jgi:hypothetical protein